MNPSPKIRPIARFLLGLTALLVLAPAARAVSFAHGEFEGNIDTTLSLGTLVRLTDPSADLIGRAAGGTAYSVNYDDGNLNYDTGIASLVGRFIIETDLKYRNYGGFVRFQGFYDHENEEGDRERTPLSDTALKRVGSDVELLDYFVWAQFGDGDLVADLRVGSQVLNWGEATFLQGGINVINPVDVSKLRLPGSELREALRPVPMVYLNLGLTPTVSVEAFYQLEWEEVRIDPTGTYFGANDFVAEGGNRVMLGFGAASDLTPLGFNARVPRGPDQQASDSGQYGAALRWIASGLGDTEFGFYYINYHSRLPYVSGTAGSLQGVLAGDYAGSANYVAVYPEDIRVYGASFNTQVGRTGIALQGELSYRDNQPLQIDDLEILFTALSAPAALLPSQPTNPNLIGAKVLGQTSQLGQAAFGQYIEGFRRLDFWQGSLTATKLFGPTLGASQWVLVAETGFTYADLPDKSVLRFDGPATYTSAHYSLTSLGIQPATQDIHDFAHDFSWGYRLLARFDYNNAFWGINMSPLLAFSHDVNGVSPLPVGNFLKHRQSITLGANFDYLQKYFLELRYGGFWGAQEHNLIHDRDFLSATFKYTF